MNPPPPIDVEREFGNFVKTFGGSLVSEIVGRSPKFANADYFFRNHGVVAELKCMEKDVLAAPNCQSAISEATEQWITAGKIPPFWGTVRIQTTKLPAECQREFFEILRKPIHGAIEKANRQIRETKANLNLPNAKGLLLLVNDGCWSIESEAMLYLADISLGNRFSSINSVVYFTVNMPARMPGVERDVLVWIPTGRKDVEAVSEDFLSRLQQGWCAYYESLIGERVPTFEVDGHQQIQNVKYVRRTQPQSNTKNPSPRHATTGPNHVVEDLLLPKGKAAEWYSMQNELQSVLKRGIFDKCLFRSGECESPPIRSHLLSRSWLQQIADSSNHIFEFNFSTDQLTIKAARIEPNRVGINEATVFPGFCNSHDAALFECLEKQDFVASRAQILSLAYRSVSQQVCRKHQMVGCNLPRALSADNHPLAPLTVGEFRRLLLLIKKKLSLEALISSTTGGLETYAVFFKKKPTVFVATTFLPSVSFTGRMLDISRYDWLTLSVIPHSDGGCALFSWEQAAPKNASLLVKSLAGLPPELVTQAILNLIFEVSEDFVLSPAWWAEIGESRQKELLRRFARTFVENKPPQSATLIPSKPVWIDWEVVRSGYI